MPRRLLRDGRAVADDWRYLAETGGEQAAPAARAGLIVSFEQWFADRAGWLAGGTRLGVVLAPSHAVQQLGPDLSCLQLICAEFPGPGEGRGYTQGRLLRERYGWGGELRATGYVRRDQLFFLARCGFNSFELPDSELDSAGGAFETFTAAYQYSNDIGLVLKPRHR